MTKKNNARTCQSAVSNNFPQVFFYRFLYCQSKKKQNECFKGLKVIEREFIRNWIFFMSKERQAHLKNLFQIFRSKLIRLENMLLFLSLTRRPNVRIITMQLFRHSFILIERLMHDALKSICQNYISLIWHFSIEFPSFTNSNQFIRQMISLVPDRHKKSFHIRRLWVLPMKNKHKIHYRLERYALESVFISFQAVAKLMSEQKYLYIFFACSNISLMPSIVIVYWSLVNARANNQCTIKTEPK